MNMDPPLSNRFSKLYFSMVTYMQNESVFADPNTNDASTCVKSCVSVRNETVTFDDMNHENEGDYQVPGWLYVTMTSLYVCIFILGIAGNLLVILVIAKDRRMRTTANFYLISLSVADLMIIAFCLPVALYELHAEEAWGLGPVLCKLAPLLQYLSTNASISTMVAISIERYIVVCRPLKIRTYCTTIRACILILLLWAFSFACSSPLLYFTVHEIYYHKIYRNDVYVCYIKFQDNEGYFYFHQAFFYVLPGVLLSILYSQIVLTLKRFKSQRFANSPDSRKNTGPGSKSQSDTKQLIFMLSAVVLSYFVCLLPYNFIMFLSLVSHETLVNLGHTGYNVFLGVSRIMFFVNSCSNPIMYNALSGKFRDAFKKFFCPRLYKNGGLESRTMSMRSVRGMAPDEDNLLKTRFQRGLGHHVRFEHGGSSRSARGVTAASTTTILARRSRSNTLSEKKSETASGMKQVSFRTSKKSGCYSYESIRRQQKANDCIEDDL